MGVLVYQLVEQINVNAAAKLSQQSSSSSALPPPPPPPKSSSSGSVDDSMAVDETAEQGDGDADAGTSAMNESED